MKKILSLLSVLAISFSSFGFGQSFTTVLDWMHTEGLTKYDQVDDFRPYDSITRGEAAKFVDQYAQLKGLPKTYNQCSFNDINGYDYTLIPHISEACGYGLIKGSNGSYNPNGNLTEAQAITIVVRSLVGFLDETGADRWSAYYAAGKELNIITSETLQGVNNQNITRQKLGTWFYKAARISQSQLESSVNGEQEIKDILREIFGNDVDL